MRLKNVFTTHRVVAIVLLILSQFLVKPQAILAGNDLETILAKHARAMGGKKKWSKMNSYTLHQRRADGRTVTCYARKPDEFKFEFEVNGQKRIKSFDGEEGFIAIGDSYRVMRPGEEIEMKEEPEFYEELLFAREQGHQIIQAEDAHVGAEACYTVRMIKSPVDTQTYWLSKSDYLIRMTGEYSEDPAHDGIYYTTVFSDYRKVDGYPFPFLLQLYANNELRATMNYEKITVNDSWPENFFCFQPSTTAGYFDYVKDQFSDQKLYGFTFEQETVRFDTSGQAGDTSIWFEAFQFPKNFRIDFGPSANNNCNIWCRDSLFVFRGGELRHRAREWHASLLLKYGFHHYSTDEILWRLDSVGIDHRIFREDVTDDGVPAYVIGAEKGDWSSPQVWMHREHNYQLRRITNSNGKKLDFIYMDHRTYEGYWIEDKVDIYVDDRLVQKEQYKDVRIRTSMNPNYFKPTIEGVTKHKEP